MCHIKIVLMVFLSGLLIASCADEDDRTYENLDEGSIVMHDGKVWQIHEGELSEIYDELTLEDGTRVSPTGDYVRSNGQTLKLEEDMTMDKSGQLKDNEGNAYDKQGRKIPAGTVIVMDGKLWQMSNGDMKEVTSPITFPNGIKVTSDGMAKGNDGTSLQLSEGMMINSSGEITNGEGEMVALTRVMLEPGSIKMEDGRLITMENGEIQPVIETNTMATGITITPGGEVTLTNGKTFTMTEGMIITKTGIIKNSKGEIVDHMGNPIPEGTIAMKDGKVMQMKDGDWMWVRAEITLSDGTKVSPGGNIISPDGQAIQMVDGTTISPNGKIMQ